MDIFGVEGVAAEVELIAAMVTLFERLGLTHQDIGIKISSRQVLAEVMQALDIPDHMFSSVCVQIDKVDKIGPEEVRKNLHDLGLEGSAAEALLELLRVTDLDALAMLLAKYTACSKEVDGGSGVVPSLQELFAGAEQ
jgi:histidyl-tRNA synthetase